MKFLTKVSNCNLWNSFSAKKLAAIALLVTVAMRAEASAAATPSTASPSPSPTAGPLFDKARLARVKALHDPMLPGEMPTYYTSSYEERARAMQQFLLDELKFCRTELHIDLALSLALLDKKQWAEVEHEMPYPMPSVMGEPPVALMPATWADAEWFFPEEGEASAAVKKMVPTHKVSWKEAHHRAGDLIGGHELGHTVIATYGIAAGTRWLNEMLASYVLYAYLQKERSDLLWLIEIMPGNELDQPQHHVSLDDFESMYEELAAKDGGNYGWYQRQFLEKIRKLYAAHGIGFLAKVRAAFPAAKDDFASLGNNETLRRLDEIDPSFSAWAKSLAVSPQKPLAPETSNNGKIR